MRVEKRDRVEWVQPEGTHFLTVDLDVFSRTRLACLAEALGDRVLLLHEGRHGSRYSAHFELSDSWQLSADQEIRRLVGLVESLPLTARRLWRNAQSRIFNIGIQAGHTPRAHELLLAKDTVDAVARVQGRIAVTIYAPDTRPVPPPSARESPAAQRGTGPSQRRRG